MNLIAIDPGYGKRSGGGCSCAYFGAGKLQEVWIASPATAFDDSPKFVRAAVVIVEEMQYDRRSEGKDPRVLLRLQRDGCLLAGLYAGAAGADVEALTPSQWKGSVPKPVQHLNLWDVLSPAERTVLGGAATERRITAAVNRGAAERWKRPGGYYYGSWTGHNPLDAAALGAIYLGRLAR